jgi:hypothetical protein
VFLVVRFVVVGVIVDVVIEVAQDWLRRLSWDGVLPDGLDRVAISSASMARLL